MSKVRVYHGSSMEVKKPSLQYGRNDADFGIGFYVTLDYEMAEKWAAIKKNRRVKKQMKLLNRF